jgi:signal peptidase I
MRPPTGGLDRALAAVTAVAAVVLVATTLATDTYVIPSSSMDPALVVDDRVIARTILVDPEVGDIVIYDDGSESGTRVSRVGAVAGDTIASVDGTLLRNGDPITDDPGGDENPFEDFAELAVPEGTVFLLSDNRGNSVDSRREGPLAVDDVVAEVVLVNVPIDRIALALTAVGGIALVVRLRRRAAPS